MSAYGLGDRWLRLHHLQEDVALDLGLGAAVLLLEPTPNS